MKHWSRPFDMYDTTRFVGDHGWKETLVHFISSSSMDSDRQSDEKYREKRNEISHVVSSSSCARSINNILYANENEHSISFCVSASQWDRIITGSIKILTWYYQILLWLYAVSQTCNKLTFVFFLTLNATQCHRLKSYFIKMKNKNKKKCWDLIESLSVNVCFK